MTDPNIIAAQKAELRHAMRELRATVDLNIALDSAEKLADNLLSVLGAQTPCTVLTYHSMPEEIDPSRAVDRLRAADATIVSPRIEGPGEISLRLVEPGMALLPGPFGLSEPPADAPEVDPRLVDLAIVPGVAFDSSGRRLGLGGGYYDRLIPKLREDCVVLGVGFDMQMVDEVPAAPHDARVQGIVTPTRVVWAE